MTEVNILRNEKYILTDFEKWKVHIDVSVCILYNRVILIWSKLHTHTCMCLCYIYKTWFFIVKAHIVKTHIVYYCLIRKVI